MSVLAVAPASATTTATEWNLASNGVDASGKSFTGSGAFTFGTSYNGVTMSVSCTITGGFAYMAPNPTPHAVPYGAISFGIDPPDNVAPGNGTCTESITGGPVTVSTTAGSRWPLTFAVPDASVASPNNGPFVGTLTIPPNSVTVNPTNFPCTLVLPTGPLPMSASYNGGSGAAVKTGSGAAFGINNASCPAVSTTGAMLSASVTLSEAGFPTRHPNMIYVP